MAGITVRFKFDARKMMRKLGATKFDRAAQRWARATAIALEFEAKKRAPVNFGRLKSSITHRVEGVGGGVSALTGTNVQYAAFQEFGTGIYGPRRRMIRPVRAKILRWKGGKAGRDVRGRFTTGFIFAREVRGVRPKRYFAGALKAERPRAEARLDREVKREMENA